MRRSWGPRLAIGVAVVVTATGAVSCSALLDLNYLSSGAAADAQAEGSTIATLDGTTQGSDGATSGSDASMSGNDGGSNGSDSGSSAEGGMGGDGGVGCPTATHGPVMVNVGGYCIDSTEVTNEQYTGFLNVADAAAQPAECNWNSTFAPKCTTLNSGNKVAVTCVNWCDAWSYCAWAGKRLCGKIGGGAVPQGSLNDSAVDQWFNACSRGGTLAYPYGNSYQSAVCNDAARAASEPLDVGSSVKCVGGYAGLFDMSGNAVEWEDACDATGGINDNCIIRSGAWDDSSASGNLTCAASNNALQKRDTADTTTGFRCCGP
jgi:hypothetical protein